MKSGILVSVEELVALEGEGADLFHLYVVGIRPGMDVKTCCVGLEHPLTYQVLRTRTMRVSRPGVGGIAHDKSKLRRMLDRLEERGLLRRIEGLNELAFECVLAPMGEGE